MAQFFNDYANLMKMEVEFYKMHWKGVIVLNVALAGGILFAANANEKRRDYKRMRAEQVKAEVEVW